MSDGGPVLAWMDLEMTGLDPEHCAVVQLALVVTDSELRELAEPLELTLWQPDSVLETMEPFVREMHRKSGLLDAIRASEVSVREAEQRCLEILSQHAPYRTARLCGNSIAQDRRFLRRYLPVLEGWLHYRMIDVSSLKELAGFWYGLAFDKPSGGEHTALFDIRQSIAELKFYRDKMLRPR